MIKENLVTWKAGSFKAESVVDISIFPVNTASMEMDLDYCILVRFGSSVVQSTQSYNRKEALKIYHELIIAVSEALKKGGQ